MNPPIVILILGFLQKRDAAAADHALLALRDRMEREIPGTAVFVAQEDDDVAGLVKIVKTLLPKRQLALVGYSNGGDTALQTAELLDGFCGVDMLLLIDPVPSWVRGRFQNLLQILTFGAYQPAYTVPKNVKQCHVWFQRNSWPRGIGVKEPADRPHTVFGDDLTGVVAGNIGGAAVSHLNICACHYVQIGVIHWLKALAGDDAGNNENPPKGGTPNETTAKENA